ncbi:hypothetical protein CVT25_004840 [Psilocybe cyanescens]|uniref:HECT-type E3 ubiquitin transferase n=1 Tax=Psilocybe cyanescens TaxID=93625 RepID=A0A409XGL4_PSICY|nr:hypothetical protein CVT25_004840 [Psilocybe cyanescens]
MLPTFGDEWKRKINLGGASSSATSPAAILSRVQAERQARAALKQRTASAVRIQAWWRGHVSVRETRQRMRAAFAADVTGLNGLRCLVLIGRDEEVLGRWAGAVLGLGPEGLLGPAIGPHGASWLVLVRQACLLLLRSVADSPQSPNALSYLQVLTILLSSELAAKVLGLQGPSICATLTEYVLNHHFYELLGQAIERIPIASKTSPSLPPLLTLVTLPLSTYPATSSPAQHAHILAAILTSILTLPLLPNRLPLAELARFVHQLPLAQLDRLEGLIPLILDSAAVAAEGKVHLAATLYAFVSPNYKALPPAAFGTYLALSAGLLNSFPETLFTPKEGGAKTTKKKRARARAGTRRGGGYASDSSDEPRGSTTRVSVVSSFTSPAQEPPQQPISIDDKTRNRLHKMTAAPHLTALISSTQTRASLFPRLIEYLFALTGAFADEEERVLSVVLAVGGGGTGGGAGAGGGGMVRGLYRDLVRSSPLGRDREDGGGAGSLFDPANAQYWPPILFLADLYSQALLTMGDDEFFGTRGGAGAGGAQVQVQRNPLTLDELIAFSRQLLNIAFGLYWRGDEVASSSFASSSGPGSSAMRIPWETVREKITRCLLGIHARDSRQPFVPPGHWLVTSQLGLDRDMGSFVEAAVLEEQQLSESSSSSQLIPSFPSSHRLPRSSSLALSNKRRGATAAALSPRLGILNNIPFAIPFEVRVSIFRHFVMNDVVQREGAGVGGGRHGRFGYHTRPRVQVRRGMVAQDGFDRLAEVDLKAPVEIAFIDQFGQEEAGIDGGGVFKEFFTSLCQEVFDTDRGLWLANKKNELYPNPHAYATEAHSLNWYRFIGRILGKAMYEGILVDVAFAGFFLAKWLGRQSFLDDLASLDPDLYNGLIFLKHYTNDPEDLSLNFTVAIDEFGVTKTVDLIPNGSNVAVTKENRLMYIYLVSHYRLSKQIKLQSDAFFEGLSEMIDQKWLRMFNQQEVQILIGGVNSPIDLVDLRRHTNYGGLYDDDHPTIVAFWNVVNSFDQEQRRALLRFVTSCSRPPLLGFKELNPNFCIRDAGTDQHRLPTSSTCVNLLKLPLYGSERTLREKILQAINSGAGFDLS